MHAVVALTLFASRAAGHAWVTTPMSKNEMATRVRSNAPSGFPGEFMYDPQSCASATVCGGSSAASDRGLDVWQQWYDQTNTAVPVLTPGTDVKVEVKISAEHGGQAWMQIACGVDYKNANWTLLERAQSDRSVGFLPSNPGMYSWKRGGGGPNKARKWHVPSSFQCPTGQAVGRWVWKTGNTCNDFNNLGRVKTESFLESESDANGGTHAAKCTGGGGFPETFLSCIDFVMNQTPTPAPPTPQPTPAPPTPPTPAPVPTPEPTPQPTPQPTQAPTPAQCCYTAGCTGNCVAGGWCGGSEANCVGCGGDWCSSAAVLVHNSTQKRLRAHAA